MTPPGAGRVTDAVSTGCALLVWSGLLLTSAPAFAQTAPTPGNCTRAQAEAYLDANNVRARILNTGGLFYRGEPHVYEVPTGGGVHSIFAAELWVGGYVGGELRAAASIFGEWEFWPGPLLPGGVLPNPDDCSAYDRIYEIRGEDLDEYILHGTISDNLREWPWHLGAPVVDGDGNPDNYDVDAGDLPELIGHQRLWWVMNDVGNVHEYTRSEALGIEVHASAFAASRPATPVDNTTVYTYRIINRFHSPIDSVFAALFNDTDLGNFDDDYIGIDTTLGLAFAYNADDDDEGPDGYGPAPPALGLMLIEGWPAADDAMDNDYDGRIDEPGEEAGIGHFMQLDWSWCGTCDPVYRAPNYYNQMNGAWYDGQPVTFGGDGRFNSSGIPTRHFWPGDPVQEAYWSEMNLDDAGTRDNTYDKKWLLSVGPFNLPPGGFAEFTFAYVWARGEDHLDSITELREAARQVRDVYDAAIVNAWEAPEPPPPPRYEDTVTRLHPNPASEYTTLRYTVSTTATVRGELFDAWGRRVRTFVGGIKEPGEYSEQIDLTGLASGLYFYRISIGHAESTGSLVLLR